MSHPYFFSCLKFSVSDHPQVLVLAGKPFARQPLLDLGNLITKHHSLLIVGKVVPEKISYRARVHLTKEADKWFEARKIKAFYNIVDGIGFEEGVRALVQASGFGKLAPNIVLMGYKSDWRYCKNEDLTSYFNVLHNAFDNRLAVAILRLPNGLDYSHLNTEVNLMDVPDALGPSNSGSVQNLNNQGLMHSDSNLNIAALTKPKSMMHADSNLTINTLNDSSVSINMPPDPFKKRKLKMKFVGVRLFIFENSLEYSSIFKSFFKWKIKLISSQYLKCEFLLVDLGLSQF